MPEFDFSSKMEETNWLVDRLIPTGHLAVVLAQAGVGKSLLVEDLAVHVVYDIPFCGFKTISGDVLVIDQDTPTNVLSKRLVNFGKAIGNKPVHKLFVESMAGYSLDNGTLITAVKNHKTARLVVVDSLHSVCGRLNPNSTPDMAVLAKFKKECLASEKTILINHHISQKVSATVVSLMQNGTNTLSMGNSAIIQQADTYYVVGANAVEGRTDRIYIRPVSKRVSIALKPVVLRMIGTNNGGEKIEYESIYGPELTRIELDIITLFKELDKERTVKEIYEEMGHRYGEGTIREALAEMEEKGLLLLSRHKSNLFKYRAP